MHNIRMRIDRVKLPVRRWVDHPEVFCAACKAVTKVDLIHHIFYCVHTAFHRDRTRSLWGSMPTINGGETVLRHLERPPHRTAASDLLMEDSIRKIAGAVVFFNELEPEILTKDILPVFHKITAVWVKAWDTYKQILYEGMKRPILEEEMEEAPNGYPASPPPEEL